MMKHELELINTERATQRNTFAIHPETSHQPLVGTEQ
jgi:hypothetical protein